MRFMVMHKNDPNTEAGLPPPTDIVTRWARSSVSMRKLAASSMAPALARARRAPAGDRWAVRGGEGAHRRGAKPRANKDRNVEGPRDRIPRRAGRRSRTGRRLGAGSRPKDAHEATSIDGGPLTGHVQDGHEVSSKSM